MKVLICKLQDLKLSSQSCVATIGNFDGLHQGHQHIIQELINQAKYLGLPACVILFEPHPQEYFLREKAPARLMRLREKIRFLKNFSVDQVICLRFNKRLADCSAEDFVKKILVERLNIKTLIIGDDFRFGKERQGDLALLEQLGKQHDFKVYSTATVLFKNERVDSSRVRVAVEQGNFVLVAQLLTRPFTLSGRVIHGDQRGRLLGFPTANIALHRRVIPLRGVFVVCVYGWKGGTLIGVANCGRRPTVNGLKDLLEIHLFNFNEDIYGYFLEIEFLKKIRDERKFDSLEALKNQITKDIRAAQNYFTDSSG